MEESLRGEKRALAYSGIVDAEVSTLTHGELIDRVARARMLAVDLINKIDRLVQWHSVAKSRTDNHGVACTHNGMIQGYAVSLGSLRQVLELLK